MAVCIGDNEKGRRRRVEFVTWAEGDGVESLSVVRVEEDKEDSKIVCVKKINRERERANVLSF